MNFFLYKVSIFGIVIITIIAIGIIIPTTPRASKSLLYSQIQKDSLLSNVKEPRIIFIGGSNLSFGLNSQLIKDSLLMNPINTAIHAAIGLQYMLDNTFPYIQKGDIIIIAPEYQQFYGSTAYGGEELLRTIADINLFRFFTLTKKQISNTIPYLLKYSFSKLKPTEYIRIKESDIYGVKSFNKYGDAYAHWTLKKQNVSVDKSISTPYNCETIILLEDFKKKVEEKDATLFITFPGYQASSFDNNIAQIKKVEKELLQHNFALLGTPLKYRMPDTIMFNTTYHLTKTGVDYRTQFLINDIRKALTHN